FFQFGVTMTVAVLLSLLEALTLTPMRCAQFVEAGHRKTRIGRGFEAGIEGLARLYQSSLGFALSHPWIVVFGSLAFCAVSIVSVKNLNKEFIPPEDQSRFLVRIQTPVGSSIDYTDSKFRQIEKFFAGRTEVNRYYVAVGGFGGGEVNTGVAFITLKE